MEKKKIIRNGRCIGIQLLSVDEIRQEHEEEDEDGNCQKIIIWTVLCDDGCLMAAGLTENEDDLFAISSHYQHHLGSTSLEFMKEGEWYTL